VPQFQPPQPQPLPQLQPINSHFSIAFPSGGVLTSEMLIADRSSLASWLAAPREVAYLTRPDGSLYAICGNTNGVLNGQTITIYPNNALAMSATYANGVRQGVMKAWNDRGNGQYWCQYSKGKKHGFCCLFDDSLLQLVLQCDRGQTAAIHLISGTAISKSFTDEDDARTDESAAACLDRLKLTEDQLLKSEQRIRRQTQREDQKLRHTWAGGLNVAKRNDIINNANLHAAQTQAIINSLRAASW
jgi:hypothetical protein